MARISVVLLQTQIRPSVARHCSSLPPNPAGRGSNHRQTATPRCDAANYRNTLKASKAPFASMPCPTILQPQWLHSGASAWIAHSKLSKKWVSPAWMTWRGAAVRRTAAFGLWIMEVFSARMH
jgi:hypothetical protein